MPGYLHSVPSSFVVLNYGGQAGTKIVLIPAYEIEARSPIRRSHGAEDENEAGSYLAHHEIHLKNLSRTTFRHEHHNGFRPSLLP